MAYLINIRSGPPAAIMNRYNDFLVPDPRCKLLGTDGMLGLIWLSIHQSEKLLFQNGIRCLLRAVTGYKSLQRFLLELCHARIENCTLIN